MYIAILKFLGDNPGLAKIAAGGAWKPETKFLLGQFCKRLGEQKDPDRLLNRALKEALLIPVDT